MSLDTRFERSVFYDELRLLIRLAFVSASVLGCKEAIARLQHLACLSAPFPVSPACAKLRQTPTSAERMAYRALAPPSSTPSVARSQTCSSVVLELPPPIYSEQEAGLPEALRWGSRPVALPYEATDCECPQTATSRWRYQLVQRSFALELALVQVRVRSSRIVIFPFHRPGGE